MKTGTMTTLKGYRQTVFPSAPATGGIAKGGGDSIALEKYGAKVPVVSGMLSVRKARIAKAGIAPLV